MAKDISKLPEATELIDLDFDTPEVRKASFCLDIAKELFRAMRRKGMSKEKLSKESGLSVPEITKMMRGGEDLLTITNIAKLCEVMDCRPDFQIFDGKEK